MVSKSTNSGKKQAWVKVVTSNGNVGYLASEVPTVVLEGLLQKLVAGTGARKTHDNVTQTNGVKGRSKRYLKTRSPR